METLLSVDWKALFVPSGSILEIILRGTVMYLMLFVLLRVIVKREAGMVGITDILVIVLIADAAQNGMAGQYQSITEGIILVATIIVWSHVLEWIGFHSPKFERLLEPEALMLVKDGRMLKDNMKAELITEDELMSKLRDKGVAELSQVSEAYMESGGEISVIRKDGNPTPKTRRKAV